MLPHSVLSWLFCPVEEQEQSRAPMDGRSVSLGMGEGEDWAGLGWVACSSRGMEEEGKFPTLLPPT